MITNGKFAESLGKRLQEGWGNVRKDMQRAHVGMTESAGVTQLNLRRA